jgi:hypothetical protein
MLSMIAKTFQDEIHAMPTRTGVPGLHEKIELLSKASRSNIRYDDAVFGSAQDDVMLDLANGNETAPEVESYPEDETEMSFDVIGKERVRHAQAFMIDSGNDFQWLLKQMETAAGMMTTGATEAHIRHHLVDLIDCNPEVTLDLAWSPVEFMAVQYKFFNGVECRLQEVICFCGAGEDVQALSCEDYTNKLWPELCLALLEYISNVVNHGAGTYKGKSKLCLPFSGRLLNVSRIRT